MKHFLLLVALVLLSASAHAESSLLPSAPVPAAAIQHPLRLVDYALISNIAVGRALDFLSTERCIHSLHCHEALLPSSLVHNRGAFAAFEVGAAGISTFSEYEGVKHGHPRMARIIALTVGATMDAVVAHNYKLAGGAR